MEKNLATRKEPCAISHLTSGRIFGYNVGRALRTNSVLSRTDGFGGAHL